MRLLPLALLLTPLVPSFAATNGPVVSARSPRATIQGTLTKPDALGCGSRASTGCDEHPFAVAAPAGTWVTVAVKDWYDVTLLRITLADGTAVAESGDTLATHAQTTTNGHVTFRQPVNGTVRYVLGMSSASPTLLTDPWSYSATVALGGRGWDRDADCELFEPEVVPPVPADMSKKLKLSVLVLAPPPLVAEVRKEMSVLVSDYAKLNIAVRLSVAPANLPSDADPDHMFAFMRKRYGGERPRGADVVYAASDYFAGGVADCIGGVRFAERAFAMGQVHYTAQGVPVPANGGVKAGHIAAHEIGHLLGAAHHFSNCAEAQPAGVQEGEAPPCTLMSPAGMTSSGQWSALEAAYVRYYVEHFARG